MRRARLIVVSICLLVQSFVANAGSTESRLLAPVQEKQKFAEAQKANSAAARQYTWKSRTELKLQDESKSIKLEQVRYDANGQLQKTPLDSGAQQQQQQPSGGRLKQKIVARKKAEFDEMIKGLAGLVTSYAHLSQNQMQAFIQNASFKLNQDEGAIQITGQPGVVPVDSMSIWVDPSTMLFRRVAINTVYDKNPVIVACTYANTASGLNYMAKAVLDYPGEDVQVTIDNYEYVPSMGGRVSLSQKDFQELQARIAFSLTPAGGKAVVGVVSLSAHTDIDTEPTGIKRDKITRHLTLFFSNPCQNSHYLAALNATTIGKRRSSTQG